MRVNFQGIKAQGKKSLKCDRCGKRCTRQATFEQTISQFNKNPDGTVRSPEEVHDAVWAELATWKAHVKHCAPCESL